MIFFNIYFNIYWIFTFGPARVCHIRSLQKPLRILLLIYSYLEGLDVINFYPSSDSYEVDASQIPDFFYMRYK